MIQIRHPVPMVAGGTVAPVHPEAYGPSLATVVAAVKHNHGNIRMDSGPGQELGIFIYLPINGGEKVASEVSMLN